MCVASGRSVTIYFVCASYSVTVYLSAIALLIAGKKIHKTEDLKDMQDIQSGYGGF